MRRRTEKIIEAWAKGTNGQIISPIPNDKPIPEDDYFWLFVMCLLSASSHFMMVKTLQVAEASVIQPFSYLQLVFGSIIGVTIFSESIDLMIIVGALIVIGSGLFITWREYKIKHNI